MGTMIACAPQSNARLIIHGSDPAILTIGDTPDDEMAPTCRYISRSSMLPCSVSTRTHCGIGNLAAGWFSLVDCSNTINDLHSHLHPAAPPSWPECSLGTRAIVQHKDLLLFLPSREQRAGASCPSCRRQATQSDLTWLGGCGRVVTALA